jgi:hypothetical protein
VHDSISKKKVRERGGKEKGKRREGRNGGREGGKERKKGKSYRGRGQL